MAKASMQDRLWHTRSCAAGGRHKAAHMQTAAGGKGHALFSDPTRLKVVAVVVDRNQREQKLMRKPHSADMDAASWKPRLKIWC